MGSAEEPGASCGSLAEVHCHSHGPDGTHSRRSTGPLAHPGTCQGLQGGVRCHAVGPQGLVKGVNWYGCPGACQGSRERGRSTAPTRGPPGLASGGLTVLPRGPTRARRGEVNQHAQCPAGACKGGPPQLLATGLEGTDTLACLGSRSWSLVCHCCARGPAEPSRGRSTSVSRGRQGLAKGGCLKPLPGACQGSQWCVHRCALGPVVGRWCGSANVLGAHQRS